MRLFLLTALVFFISAPIYALELSGVLTQGGLVIGTATPGSKIELDGQQVELTDEGHFVFGFGRDHGAAALLKITTPESKTEEYNLVIRQREYNIQRIDKLPGKMVSPPEGTWERIASDRTLVANARENSTSTPHFLRGFIRPAEGIVSGVYGSQRILNGKPKQPHYGVDYAAPEGAPVMAPADGIVRLAHADLYYTGGTIIIDHGHGVSSTLMHMSALHVEAGQRVKQGALIGAVGSTGRATGPHLDWRMNWRDARIDPMTLVPELTE